MSYIKLKLHTDKETGDVSIDIKSECSLLEFEVATTNMMAVLGESSTTGIQLLEATLKHIKESENDRATDTEEDNNDS